MDKKRCKWSNGSEELRLYHDFEYGFKIDNDFLYFERLTLEIFQAGLSWATILKKRPAFRKAFENFDFYKIAKYNNKKIEDLLSNKEIIRNKRKIFATIYNAMEFIKIIESFGNFNGFILKQQIDDKEKLLKIFKERFKFIGPLILEEFMLSVGLWNIKHEEECFLYKK